MPTLVSWPVLPTVPRTPPPHSAATIRWSSGHCLDQPPGLERNNYFLRQGFYIDLKSYRQRSRRRDHRNGFMYP